MKFEEGKIDVQFARNEQGEIVGAVFQPPGFIGWFAYLVAVRKGFEPWFDGPYVNDVYAQTELERVYDNHSKYSRRK